MTHRGDTLAHMLIFMALSCMLLQSADSGAVVAATQIDSTMKHSVENNILDTKVNETAVKGGIVRVGIVHRKNAEAAALMHQELTEIYQIIEGSGTMTIGGAMPSPRAVQDPPNLGPTPTFSGSQTGGISRKVGPKDLVIVPAGLPHRWTQLDGPISYVIYRFEPSQAK